MESVGIEEQSHHSPSKDSFGLAWREINALRLM